MRTHSDTLMPVASPGQQPDGRTWTPLWLGYLGVTAVLVGIGTVRIRQQARL
jgi:hypothetical protein